MPNRRWGRPSSGWGALGDMLAGNVGTPGVYEDALRGRYDAEHALQRARRERSNAIIDGVRADNFVGIPTMGAELGISDAEARLLAAGGGNSQQLTGGLSNLRELGYRDAAQEAALGGDWNAANAHLAGVATGPLQLAAVQGDTVLGNLYVEGGDVRGLTPLGEARAASSHAQAASARGRLGIAQQQFDLQRAGQWNPSGQSGGGSSGGGKFSHPAQGSLTRAFEAPDANNRFGPPVFNQERYMDFLRWREQNPAVTDGERALAQYLIEASGTPASPIFVDPSMPGQPRPQAPARPQSKAEYDALPPGTQFIAPDGSNRIKP